MRCTMPCNQTLHRTARPFAAGNQDRENAKPVRTGSIFRICSMTKPITIRIDQQRVRSFPS